MARLPKDYTSISDAFQIRNGAPYNVIGVLTDSLPPKQTYGTDCTMKMVLWDASCMDNPDLGSKGMVVRYFRGEINSMPNVQEAGDVVILRNAVTRNTRGQWMGLSNWTTRWNVIPGSALAETSEDKLTSIQQRPFRDGRPGTLNEQGPAPTELELKYAKKLLELRSSSGPLQALAQTQQSGVNLPISSSVLTTGQRPTSHKFRLVKDLRDQRQNPSREFVDLVGEIQHVFHGRNPVEVKITDYTDHPCLYQGKYGDRDGDEFGYTTRRKQTEENPRAMVISLHAWDAQGEYIRQLIDSGQLKLGMYVSVTNVCVKMDRNGTMLEGHLRSAAGESTTSFTLLEAKKAARIQALENLLQRKREFEKTMKASSQGIKDARPESPPAQSKKKDISSRESERSNKRDAPADEEEEVSEKQLSKNALKKKRRKLRQAEEKQKQQEAVEQNKDSGKSSEAVKKPAQLPPQPSINPNVRCQDLGIALTRLSTILDEKPLEHKTKEGAEYKWPFLNRKYRSRVRIRDYFPPRLEDFTSLKPKRRRSSDASEQSVGSLSDGDAEEDRKWQWNFYLMVEDVEDVADEEKGLMLLQIAGEDGDLLFNMEACDLRKRTRCFEEMKNKLFLLWGELQEKVEEHGKDGLALLRDGVAIRSLPFECLITEFGVRACNKFGEELDDQWERCHRLIGTRIVQ